jgi:DNA-binding NtrC family response regulator
LIARGLPNRRILLVGHDPHVRWVVSTAARDLQAEVRGLDSSDQLVLTLHASPFDLVVVCGAAAAGDAQHLLSKVRRARPHTPCLIATFIHPCLAQVVVMDAAGRPASTKVVDFGNLGRLPGLLLAGTDPWFSVD